MVSQNSSIIKQQVNKDQPLVMQDLL